MTVRVHPPGLAAFLTVSLILGTFSDLAGPMSAFVSVFAPALALASLAHLLLSWRFFSFHQTFSTDHPQKGETVHYGLHMVNEGPIPLAPGHCGFSKPGPQAVISALVRTPSGPGEAVSHPADIHCPWRGTYEIGLNEIHFRDSLGIVEIIERAEPRVFYVYPELVRVDPSVSSIARAAGSDRAGGGALERDVSIFEYFAPLRAGAAPQRVAWKRWAATGTPAEIVTGQSRSAALRLVLDLRPAPVSRQGRLPAEDLATSAAFSALGEFARQEIPVEFILGGEDRGTLVDSTETFLRLFDASTSLIFSDARFPAAAFTPGTVVLLVTTRPLVESGDADIFTLYEECLARGTEPHVIACPPPELAAEVRRSAETLAERQLAFGARGLLRVADPADGTRELANALRP